MYPVGVSVCVYSVRARANTNTKHTNPNQLLLYKLYFTMSISNWLVFTVCVSARATVYTYLL